MFSRKADASTAVQVPAPEDDRPSWIRVGIITAIGFAVGVAWPRLAGVKLAPSAPADTAASAAATASGEPASQGAPVPTQAAAVMTAPAPTAAAVAPPQLQVSRGLVVSCKTADGEAQKGGACGSVGGIDALAQPRLKKLADCPGAEGASGKLHVTVHLDFERGTIGVDIGRGNTVAGPDALFACARTAFEGTGVGSLTHDNPKYDLVYTVVFAGGQRAVASAMPSASTKTPAAAGSGNETEVEVAWEVAIVRDAPKTGKVLARLQRGTALRVGAVKEGWYPVKYGSDYSSEGWVYRGAIGK
jgi:hypothetical protein